MDKALRAWLRSSDEEDEQPAAFDALLARPEESLSLFGLCRATDWHVLPAAGGWLDQPDWFIHDMSIIGQRLAYLRRRKRKGQKALDKLKKKFGR